MQDQENDQEIEEPTEEAESEPAEEAAAEPAPETPEPVTQKPANVQSPNCDPVYKTMKGTLAAAVKQITGLVREAKQKWSTDPKYPKADLPEPPPRPVTTRTREPDKPKQPTFF